MVNSISDLNLLRTFVKLAELKSFTKTASHLNQPKSRVSRAITRLETELGVPLVRRTTRHTSLTSAGQNLFEQTHELLQSLENRLLAVSESSEVLSGELVITVPEDIAETILAPLIKRFRLQYPNVGVRVIVTNALVDLSREGIDVAIRIGRGKPSALIQKKLARVGVIAVASPEYLRRMGPAKSLGSMGRHRLLLFEKFNRGWLKREGASFEESQIVAQANSFPLLSQMALDSMGITFLPEFFCKRLLNDGKLVRVLLDLKANESDVCALYLKTKPLPKKTRAFIDHLSQEFQSLV